MTTWRQKPRHFCRDCGRYHSGRHIPVAPHWKAKAKRLRRLAEKQQEVKQP